MVDRLGPHEKQVIDMDIEESNEFHSNMEKKENRNILTETGTKVYSREELTRVRDAFTEKQWSNYLQQQCAQRWPVNVFPFELDSKLRCSYPQKLQNLREREGEHRRWYAIGHHERLVMSTNQPKMPPPFIGSKISLISKLDIRYEGTLYTVDPVESTIALAKVHSYGTEDRLTPVFVPPRNEVYDFIIFKASDIKDLIVCEPPKESRPHFPLAAGLPYDPAIVSISKNPPPEPKLPTKLNMMKPTVGIGGMMKSPAIGIGGMLKPQAIGIGGMMKSPAIGIGGMMKPQAIGIGGMMKPQANGIGGMMKPPSGIRGPSFDNDFDFEKANEEFQKKIEGDHLEGGEEKGKEKLAAPLTLPGVVQQSQQTSPKLGMAIKMEGSSAGYITKEHLENMTMAKKLKLEFYNKKDSFFDSISCDALEKEAGRNVRPDWKRERMTNQETFGYSAVRSLFFQHRGMMRHHFMGNRPPPMGNRPPPMGLWMKGGGMGMGPGGGFDFPRFN